MRELDEYRDRLLDRLSEAADEFRLASLAVKNPYAPLEPGGWSVHQLAVHTRDVDRLVYGARARRTLDEENPLFEDFDGDSYLAQHYERREPLPEVLEALVVSIDALGKLLREMPAEAWSRVSRHETQSGSITLQAWVERGLGHIEEHLATVKKAETRNDSGESPTIPRQPGLFWKGDAPDTST